MKMLEILVILLAGQSPPDSLRMETINGKSFVVYQVGEKETLYGIARKYGATLQQVLEVNPSADAGIEVGQILKIPYTPRTKPQFTKTADGVVHKVAPKETLFSIARHYNVSVADLRTWNHLKEDASLSVGQDLLIRNEKTETVVKEATPVQTQTTTVKTHVVQPKETLYGIARLYNMSVDQLKQWNSIQGNELKVGQVLSVSAPAANGLPNAVVKEQVRVSETVTGSDEMHEKGTAALIEGSESNRKYLGQHKSIPPGTILKVKNLDTNLEVFVRITGPSSIPQDEVMIRLSRSAMERLGATDGTFRAELVYYK